LNCAGGRGAGAPGRPPPPPPPPPPAHYRDLLKRTIDIHRRFHAEWPALAQQYRDALPEITSPEAWDTTFAPWTEGPTGGDE
ncbi:MAG: hypothetical protein LH477_02975, partial [Nocardioides sp.]|nr:hypothetical protein [Nocardioides sp.]